ncbi:oligopeptide transport system ATP-binding protein [Nonomuraea fuscirosea]|uniref:Oligopeptide transport system ATP-binding protein n=1 Tax=Nonomuraea fuscirosea TaxID=1291556 RepID=A0A2T0NB45_9ACTN|nr:ABC transporter ATP-binding protein [Nonomuraea fuscirosea]PRX70219.1 oligopeptide transport system ATP-binding protein [Nonomuraea fuscirosea]
MSSVLEINDLHVEFRLDADTVKPVNGVSLSVEAGETLAVVGESGSGKTATALSILRLHPTPPCHYTGGEILAGGRDLLKLPEREMRAIRGNEIAMVFQDPMTSLNPLKSVGAQIAESLRLHQGLSRSQARAQAVQALREVGIPNPEQRAGEYPHQFSGGMRQRVMIAIALACRPKVLIADEPTTALDVTVQAQIMELLAGLQERFGMAIVLITHDLGVVARCADRVLVMYGGRPVELAAVDEVFAAPRMPYTRALLRSMPRSDVPGGAPLDPIPGSPPNLFSPPGGCAFHPRCALALPECSSTVPPLTERAPGHSAACLLEGSL